MFNSNVKSVLLYGCETWFISKVLINKLQVFVNNCLRRILKIWWPQIISNSDLHSRCQEELIDVQIKRRKWKWIGHTLRKEAGDVTRQALDWNPQGSRRKGRPKISWRRTIQYEVRHSGKCWKELKLLATDRDKWRQFVEALCSTRSG